MPWKFMKWYFGIMRNEQLGKLPRENCQIHYQRGVSAVRKERR